MRAVWEVLETETRAPLNSTIPWVIGEVGSKTYPFIEPEIFGAGGFILQPVAKIKSKHTTKNIPGDGPLAGFLNLSGDGSATSFTFFNFLINNNNDKNLPLLVNQLAGSPVKLVVSIKNWFLVYSLNAIQDKKTKYKMQDKLVVSTNTSCHGRTASYPANQFAD